MARFEPSLPDVKFKKFSEPMDTTGPPFCNNELVVEIV